MHGPRWVLAAAIFGCAATVALHEPCTSHPWEYGYQLWHYCYSDIMPLYYERHLDVDHAPYVQEFTEYPVLTGAFSYGVARLTTGVADYMHLTVALLLACGAAVTVGLWRLRLAWPRVALWAAGPSFVFHALTNWDLPAVALATGGWWAWTRKRPMLAATLFGLGGAAKVYPALFLPFLFLDTLRRRDRNAATDVVVGGLLGLVLPNLVVWRLAPENWWAVWRFHAARFPDFETPWEVFRVAMGLPVDPAWRSAVGYGGLAVILLVAALLARRLWQGRVGPLAAGGLAVLTFVLFNRVYSPQYTLWVLPILLLLSAPLRPVLLFVAADAANDLVRYPYLAVPAESAEHAWLAVASHVLVFMRWTFLAACAWRIAHQEGILGRPRHPDAQAHAGPADVGAAPHRPTQPTPAPPAPPAPPVPPAPPAPPAEPGAMPA